MKDSRHASFGGEKMAEDKFNRLKPEVANLANENIGRKHILYLNTIFLPAHAQYEAYHYKQQ